MKRSRRIVRRRRRVLNVVWKQVVRRSIVTVSLLKPEAQPARGRSRLLRKRRATPRALREIFVDVVVVADVVERPETGAGAGRTAASVRSAANFEANLEANHEAKSSAKRGVNLAVNLGAM